MAITAATVTSDFSGFLPAHQAAPIFERAARVSVAQSLIPQVPLGISGESIPVVTGRPSVGWVGEGEIKPASSGSMTLKSMVPKKLAGILVVSAEVVRANPGGYVPTMQNSFAEAIAVAFDRAVFHDEGPAGQTGGGPFSTYLDQTTKTVEIGTTAQDDGGIHGDLVQGMREIVTDADASGRKYRLNGWALDSVVEPELWDAVDKNGRPLYTELSINAESDGLATPGRLLNRRSFIGEGVATLDGETVVGYGGDFSQAAWGQVGGLSYRISTEATVTINGALTSLWEHNLLAILVEAEYGFVMNDADAFVKLTNSSGS